MTFKTVILIVGLIGLLGYGVYILTLFSVSFSLNLCYSDVLIGITEEAKEIAKTHDEQRMKKFTERLDKMPVAGYETDCYAVRKSIIKHEHN